MRKFGLLFLVMGVLMVAVSASSFAGILVSIVAPPAIPYYVQPECPQPGMMWTPGYWAMATNGDYYWVDGAWVAAPSVGLLWTPGYWAFSTGYYRWHAGYWNSRVGYYGGINYGYGYTGVGFVGGEWRGGRFFYNSAVMNFGHARPANAYIGRTVNVNHGSPDRSVDVGPRSSTSASRFNPPVASNHDYSRVSTPANHGGQQFARHNR
jgi:hypothetical protein